MTEYSVTRLQTYCPVLEELYKALTVTHYFYLPQLSSSAVTEDYLLGVVNREFFGIKFNAIDWYSVDVTITKEELFRKFLRRIQQTMDLLFIIYQIRPG